MCEANINKDLAHKFMESAISTYEEYGEETAEEEYSKAMKLLEKLKRQIPWDDEVQDMYTELKTVFGKESGPKSTSSALQIQSIELSCLFPSLMNVYQNNPSGFISVRNKSSGKIKSIRVTSYIRHYMDFQTQGESVEVLEPGEECLVEIKTPINKNSLSLTEARDVQVHYTLKWIEDGIEKSTSVTRPVTICKKSAISWADTRMLSCFITGNGKAVSSFAFKAMENKGETFVSSNFTKAVSLANALGAIPLNYVSDPVTPISQVIDNEYSIDTVRFPGETLSLKGGDCDDMTALYCSLLDCAGIPCGMITTPGHIFAAFSTGNSYSKVHEQLGSECPVIEVDGKKIDSAYVPVDQIKDGSKITVVMGKNAKPVTIERV